MKLYTYFRSSAAYRVRIALHLKGLGYDAEFIDLRHGAERLSGYRDLNPQGLVPVLVDGGQVLSQSLAIIEYLDETHPEPPLLPDTAVARARVRALAQLIACDIHPLNNLRVLHYLERSLDCDEAARLCWYRHWVDEGLAALETLLANHPATGRFCHGDTPTLADLCLVPQVYNARRFRCELAVYPTLGRINEACLALAAFQAAAPENQVDAQ